MNPSSRLRNLLAGVVTVVGVAAAILLLDQLGHGSLAAPPLRHWSALHRWMTDHDGPTMAVAVLRIVALVAAWYLLIVINLGLLARLSRIPRLVRLADLATVPAVRRLLEGVVGATMTASMGAMALVPLATVASRPTPVAAHHPSAVHRTGRVAITGLPSNQPSQGSSTPHHESQPHTATMTVIAPPRPEAVTPAPSRSESLVTWTVQPGEHFWHAAQEGLAEAWGRRPTDREIASYWTTIVAHNRSRLVDPANPDLIFAGQVFELPPPPPSS